MNMSMSPVRIVLSVFALVVAMSASLALPVTASAQDAEATTLLNASVERMKTVESFRFELTTVQGTSVIMNNLELAGIEGAVKRPDRFMAIITAKVAFVEVDVRIVGIGSRLWVTDPLADSESYIEVTDEVSGEEIVSVALRALVNPDEIMLAAVGLVQNPEIDGTETVDGVKTTRITGTVDLRQLPQFQQATPEAADQFLALEEMPITIWIDGDGLVRSLELEGPITADESPDVIRRLDLFDYDMELEILEPPAS
jgi:hypothetical protein